MELKNLFDLGDLQLADYSLNFNVVRTPKISLSEDFQNDDKYKLGDAALVSGWDIHNGNSAVKFDSPNLGSVSKALMIGPFADGTNSDNAYVDIPITAQTGILQVEYSLLTPGGGAQPFFEAYGDGQKRLRLASPDRHICAVQNLTNDKDYASNILLWNQNSDFRVGSSVVTTYKYVIDIPNKKYDLYITNPNVTSNDPNLIPPARNIGGNTVLRSDIPLLGDSFTIDKLRFSGLCRLANDVFSVAVVNFKASSITNVTSVITDKGAEIINNSSITSLTQSISLCFSDDMRQNTLNQSNIKLISLNENNAELTYTGVYNQQRSMYTITPAAPLKPNGRYKLVLSGLMDTQNNPVTNVAELTFLTNDIPFRISGSRFLDSLSSPVTGLAGKAAVTAELSFVNEYDTPKAITIIITQNSAAGEMKNIVIRSVSVSGSMVVTVPITVNNYEAGDKIRGMVWDNMGSMKGMFSEIQSLN